MLAQHVQAVMQQEQSVESQQERLPTQGKKIPNQFQQSSNCLLMFRVSSSMMARNERFWEKSLSARLANQLAEMEEEEEVREL